MITCGSPWTSTSSKPSSRKPMRPRSSRASASSSRRTSKDKRKSSSLSGKKGARTDYAVLIAGESGVGKELIANALHRESDRADGPFVPLNCGAIPESMIESELFGYEKGAFTAPFARKVGLLELASNGTLLLGEIGDMSQPM